MADLSMSRLSVSEQKFEAWSRRAGSRRSGNATSKHSKMRRWDGASKTSRPWDFSDKDEELWLRNGDCLIHAYAKGFSRRGPSFKIPLSAVLKADCIALLDRFADDDALPRTCQEIAIWKRVHPGETINVYLPPPGDADHLQILQHHLAIRNFAAWIMRRSLVAEHLGDAFVMLFECLEDLRSGADNMAAFVDYIEEEGYLDYATHPAYAIAVLRFAEIFKSEKLYPRAFAHCTGMSQQLSSCPEYIKMTSAARRLIRNASTQLEFQLEQATAMLSNFLDDDFSEANLGFSPGVRAHLERFRAFLVTFYRSSLGEYPSRSFQPRVLRSMRRDFKSLYNLLADTNSASDQIALPAASGNICTLPILEAFEQQFGFKSLEHSHPLLPNFSEQAISRRFSWFSADKLRADQRVPALAALIKASNWRGGAYENELVQAFCRFEESSVLETENLSRHDRISMVDARKIEWILTYATYQVLQSVSHVRDGEEEFDLSYHLPDESKHACPWENRISKNYECEPSADGSVFSPEIVWGDSDVDATGKIEIKPDIDYLGISQRKGARLSEGVIQPLDCEGVLPPLKRAKSLSRALNRQGTLRKSLRKLRPSTASSQKIVPTAKSAYHEIVVHGYGNGTRDVNILPAATRPALDLSTSWPNRTHSTMSQAKSAADSSMDSESTIDGCEPPDTPITLPSPPLYDLDDPVAPDGFATDEQLKKDCDRSSSKRRRVVSMITPSLRRPVSNPSFSKRRPISQMFQSKDYVDAWEELSKENPATSLQRQPSAAEKPNSFFSLTRSMSVRPSFGRMDTRRKSHTGVLDMEAEVNEDLYNPTRPSEDWAAMQAFLDDDEYKTEIPELSAWEQYADLGGLTEVR